MIYIGLYDRDKVLESRGKLFETYSKKAFFTTNEELDFSEKLKINDKLYCTCCSCKSEDKQDTLLLVEEFEFKADSSYVIENEITCPFCGAKLSDSWDYSDNEDEINCENCGSDFSYTREVTVDYWCNPVRKNEDIKELK